MHVHMMIRLPPLKYNDMANQHLKNNPAYFKRLLQTSRVLVYQHRNTSVRF